MTLPISLQNKYRKPRSLADNFALQHHHHQYEQLYSMSVINSTFVAFSESAMNTSNNFQGGWRKSRPTDNKASLRHPMSTTWASVTPPSLF